MTQDGHEMNWLPDLQDLIEAARRDGASSLNLNGRALDSLPESLRSLTTLARLDVNANRLTVLPDWLGGLTSLTSLGLSGNQLAALPDWLGNLTGLTELWVGGNQLSGLPESLGNLTALRRLGLSGNQLAALPGWLGDLSGITRLDLSRNRLTALPDWLGNLTGLTELRVGGNQLSGLPESLGNLTALRRLDLSGNRLTVLPDWLGNLTGLTRLDLIGNPLTLLPEWLGSPAAGEHPPGAPLHAWTGDAPVTVTGAADLDAILNGVPGGVTLTSEDGARLLHIILDGDRSGLAWEGDHDVLISWGPVPPGAPPGQIAGDAEDAFDDPWFTAADEDSFGDITEGDARQAGHEFLRTGRRPANIQWLDKP
jgi:Leucine-rich repeat (LRR) protein